MPLILLLLLADLPVSFELGFKVKIMEGPFGFLASRGFEGVFVFGHNDALCLSVRGLFLSVNGCLPLCSVKM